MTGLILKDLVYLRRTARIVVILLAFYLILFSASGGDSAAGVLSGATVLLTMILSVNAFAYDEAAKWSIYERSLPVAKSGIVLARYLLALIFSTAMTLISFLMELFVNRGLSSDNLAALWASWSIALLFSAVLFPLIYKYGTQKARLALMIIVLLPTLGVILLQKTNLPMPSESALMLAVRLIPLFSVAAYFVSYLISCRVFARREN